MKHSSILWLKYALNGSNTCCCGTEKPLSDINHILSSFTSLSLEEMDLVQLLNRTDTKFILNSSILEKLLSDACGDYSVLSIAGVRQSHYETLYYDRKDFYHYLTHQNGKRNRSKIRKRRYTNTNLTYLEVKLKNNKGRTLKSRIRVDAIDESIDTRSQQFLNDKLKGVEILEPKLYNYFDRITLVNRLHSERLTIDCNLSFAADDRVVAIPSLVIAEIKQDTQNRHSIFMQQLKELRIRQESISKYCLGVSLLFPEIKSNNFKEKILRINKIIN